MKTQQDNFLTNNLTTNKKKVSMKMTYQENKNAAPKDKKNTEKIKGEKKEDKLNKNPKINEEGNSAISLKTKLHNTVTKKKIMTKHKLVTMTNKEGESSNNFMHERELESQKLYWTEFKANHKKKLMKCIKESSSKTDKIKFCSLHLKIIKHTLFNAKWARKKKLFSLFLKRLNTIKRLKIKSLKFKLLQQCPWKKNIQEKSLLKLKIKKSSDKVSKDLLMLISKKLTDSNIKIIQIFL